LRSPNGASRRPARNGGAARAPGRAGPAVRSDPRQVSPLTVNRLSVYLRSLRALEARGVRRVSSLQLAREFNLSASLIRKDLAQFGEFGVRGVGYDVTALAEKLVLLLRLDRQHRIVLVGMGSLGTALARFPAFNSGSFRVVAGFDTDSSKIGRRIGSVPVHDPARLPTVVRATEATIAILAVPAEDAAGAYAALAAAGIRSVLNFAPTSLAPLPGCRIKSVDLRIPLEELSFFLDDAP
jgi:redox-sensing transcriptional repressor